MRANQVKIHPCVCFILIDGNNVLLEKRAANKEIDPGTLSIPGGHMERDETQQQTLVRELMEELNLTPLSYQFLCSLHHPASELQLLHYYVVNHWEGEMQVLEAEQVSWHPIVQAPVAIAADQIALAEYIRVYNSF